MFRFDLENAHEKPHLTWQLETEKDFMTGDDDVFAKHQKFLNAAKEVMQDADQEDKEVQKEKRREKRRIQKLKEKSKGYDEVCPIPVGNLTIQDAGVVLGGGSDVEEDVNDQSENVSDNHNESDEASDDEPRATKRKDRSKDERPSKRAAVSAALSAPLNTIADEEELALKLLQNRF
jgi:ATP-dependent RNA helicase DDX10/DBP4